MTVKLIDELPIDGKRVFIRVDFNVARKDGKIVDDTRMRAALPTINYALEKGCKVILASHLGRPKGTGFEEEYSMKELGAHLAMLLNHDVIVPENCIGSAVKKLANETDAGDVMLLENLRFHEEEKKNNENFAKELASIAEVYINDAFGAAHRAHASTAGMARFMPVKGAGFLMKKELDYLGGLISAPQKPFLAILGGAKVSDKIAIIENLLDKVDAFLIGGGMAYTFLKAKDVSIGNSLFEEPSLHMAKRILERASMRNVPILLPVDHVIARECSETCKGEITRDAQIPDTMLALDIGPKTRELFTKEIAKAKTIFWNGPLGVFELAPFAEGTLSIARAVSASGATTVIGGGDSVAAVNQAGVADKISHISTGGGASLEFVEGKLLPGVAALEC